MAPDPDAEWIFGYGSLLWRVEFPYIERQAGSLEGWARRFWQGSTDHRGVPGAPGRVVTLVRASGSQCWGAAYRVERANLEATMAQLDYREKGGYERLRVPIALDDGRRITSLLYLASARNGNYLGPAPIAAIAGQIEQARGPSGANLDYLLRLAESLEQLGHPDPHVSEILAAIER